MEIDATADSLIKVGKDTDDTVVDRVIVVSNAAIRKTIGVDGDREAIEMAIKAAFGLPKERYFWLEDEDKIVRPLNRNMRLGNYTLHVDKGVTIRVKFESGRYSGVSHAKTFYSDDGFSEFLTNHGIECLRQTVGTPTKYAHFYSDLVPGCKYECYRP